LKKVLKKFADIRKVATFATALRSKRPLKRKETGSEKFLKILAKRFGEKKNLSYLCKRFRLKNESNVLKKSLKNLAKRFGGLRKRFYLCTTFRSEKADKQNEVERPLGIGNVLIVIYEQRSLKLLSS